MLSENSRLSARVSTQAAEFGNDPIVQTAGAVFTQRQLISEMPPDSAGHHHSVCYDSRDLCGSVCASLCIRVCACVHVGGADYKKTVFHVFLLPFFHLKGL